MQQNPVDTVVAVTFSTSGSGEHLPDQPADEPVAGVGDERPGVVAVDLL